MNRKHLSRTDRVAAILSGGAIVSALPSAALALSFPAEPIFSMTSGALCFSQAMLLAWSTKRLHRRHQDQVRHAEELSHEVDALNDHAMVSVTDTNARIVSVNDRFIEATGWSRADLIGRKADVCYFDSDIARFRQIRAQLDDGRPWSGETRLRRKDGSPLWTRATIRPRLDKQGRLIGSISVRTDITETKAAAGEREMVSTLHELADEVYMFDPVTLRFLYMNDAARSRLRWTPERYHTKTILDALPGFDLESFRMRTVPLLTGAQSHIVYNVSILGRLFEARIQLIEPSAGASRFVVVLRDQSEREEIERIKDEFISTVSHELRSPLTSIKGSMGLILAGAAGHVSDKQRKMLEIAHRNADRLVLIVNDILDLEKIAAGRMDFHIEPGSLNEIVDEAIQGNQPFADRFDVTVRSTGFDNDVTAEFDPDRLFQVMTNLLSNAAKFWESGGEIVVSLRDDGDRVWISVQDFGAGIPEEAQARIFDRFQQADNSDHRKIGGTGLGLSIVKAILDKHHSVLQLESVEGEGTTFTFSLQKPVAATAPQHFAAS